MESKREEDNVCRIAVLIIIVPFFIIVNYHERILGTPALFVMHGLCRLFQHIVNSASEFKEYSALLLQFPVLCISGIMFVGFNVVSAKLIYASTMDACHGHKPDAAVAGVLSLVVWIAAWVLLFGFAYIVDDRLQNDILAFQNLSL